MCKENEETGNHLFIHCKIASFIWYSFFDLLGVQIPIPFSVKDLVSQLSFGHLQSGGILVWKIARGVMLWELWKERNRRTFEEVYISADSLLDNVKLSIWHWFSITKDSRGVSQPDVLFNLQNLFLLGKVKMRPKCFWTPPKASSFKLNFDGSSLGNTGLAGIGGVLRNDQGQVIFSYAGPLSSATCLIATRP
ncbi:uncharacterized protein LOC105420238 [Amborella trichopoda]|uniref:uncharacterized protein LOC105420238 n=1 Tax=Amborella trichopoda TaxID=13333 RepID=UPI0005D3FFF4|nr:uncharacterized protein LOC105420238 [Amborella trichopoda]|eukprot:XP_011621330.1 uncharacterized protein LOC105420238 [Amborella trichopoda]